MKHLELKQKGAILLLLLLIFLIAGTSLMFGTFNNRQDIYARQQAELSNQLQLAKEALLAFAANSSAIYSNSRGPGFFPCPDKTGTGIADADCDSSSVNLGRLPEYIDVAGNKIFFNSYYAGAGRQFWYAIAPHYVYTDDEDDRRALNRISTDNAIASTRLTVDGTDKVVALIFAPGEALGSEDRDTAPLASNNFLEGGNGDIDGNFFTSFFADPTAFNDQLIAITHNELMAYIGTNVIMEIKRLLDADYAGQPDPKHYPGDPDDLSRPADYYHSDFATALAGNVWLTEDISGNSEKWAFDTIYTLISATKASIQFKGCPGMTFTFEYGGKIIRNGSSC